MRNLNSNEINSIGGGKRGCNYNSKTKGENFENIESDAKCFEVGDLILCCGEVSEDTKTETEYFSSGDYTYEYPVIIKEEKKK